MRITALEEYGLRCMLLLARNDDVPLTLVDFGERESLSIPYAGKLLMILRKAGLVTAVRGRKGGYKLTRKPEKILLKEIFDALGEPVFSPSHCHKFSGSEDDCIHREDCSVRTIWQKFGGLIGNVLARVTLDDLASGRFDLISSKEMIRQSQDSSGN